MLKELISTSYRVIRKNQKGSAINIAALAIGISSVLFVANLVIYEFSYDGDLGAIYRIEVLDDSGSFNAYSSPTTGPGLIAEMKGNSSFTQLIPFSEYRSANLQLTSDSSDRFVYFKRAYYADSSVFDFFNLSLLAGSSHDFTTSGAIVISKSAAINIFGANWAEAVGTVIKQGRGSINKEFIVVGVFEDREPTTHIDFDALISMASQNSREKTLSGYTYVSGDLKPTTDSLYLRPVQEIHTSKGVSNEAEPVANRQLLKLLTVVALIILLITISNYVNSTIVHFVDRYKEVGIRKLHGASIGHLVKRLLVELLLINAVAACLGVALFLLAQMAIHRIEVIAYPAPLENEWIQLFYILVTTVVFNAFISSIYPFVFLSRIEIVSALKGAGSLLKTKAFGEAGNVLRVLLIFQLIASVVFLSFSLVIHRQLKLLSEQPFDTEIHITGVFPGTSGANEKFARISSGFLEEMTDFGTIREYSFSNLYQGQIKTEQRIPLGDSTDVYLTVVDPGIANGLNRLIAGSGFDHSFGYNPGEVILDSVLSDQRFGYNDSTKVWSIEGGRYHTLGIIHPENDDVHRAYVSGFRYLTYMDLVLNYDASRGDRLDEFLEKTEYMISTRFPFFFLMRRELEASGKAEEDVLLLFIFFGGVCVLVSAIGLFGLAYFVIQKKNREVGIRKIHGASPIQILFRLLGDFGGLIFLGGILSVPIVYYGAQLWLQDYAVRIDLEVSIFLLPILGIAFISLLTVLSKSWKAATLNPVEVLKEK